MLNVTTRDQLATAAYDMATGSQMLLYQSVLYIPADYETLDVSSTPLPERRVWLPLTTEELWRMAADRQNILLRSDAERRSYHLMVRQSAQYTDTAEDTILLRTPDGLRALHDDGSLRVPSQRFTPYFIETPLNPDPDKKAELLAVMLDWLGEMEDVESLLAHLATILAPHWSAVRYVLLIGAGRNGKSLLLEMLRLLFGYRNVSHVTRQAMAGRKPECLELANKMLNTVADGEASYLKDSGAEKAFTSGDPVSIHRLFQSEPELIRTNALFIEGLNKEPKSGDKSMALQKRLVRFSMTKVYPEDEQFKRHMLAPEMLGALLSLLVDRYVPMAEISTRLTPTRSSLELRMEQMHINDKTLQFLVWYAENDALGINGLAGENLHDLAKKFQDWRLQENDISPWPEVEVKQMLRPLFITKRTSVRIPGKGPRKEHVIVSLTKDTIEFLNYHTSIDTEETDDAVQLDTVVDD